jgi:hypothetical protein
VVISYIMVLKLTNGRSTIMDKNILIHLLKTRNDIDNISKEFNLDTQQFIEKVRNGDLSVDETIKLKRLLNINSLHYIFI